MTSAPRRLLRIPGSRATTARFLGTCTLASSLVFASSLALASPARAATVDVASLADIAAAWANGDTARLTADVTAAPGQLVATGAGANPSVLDLAGHDLTITGPDSRAAVRIPSGRSLTVADTVGGGTLTATGGPWAAGIGGDLAESCGDLQIDGAHVVGIAVLGPYTGYDGAGVGGGAGDGMGAPPGAGCTTTMSSGYLQATAPASSTSAAAVGAGSDAYHSAGSAGSVSVAGSATTTVVALGDGYGAHGGRAALPTSSGAVPGVSWAVAATGATGSTDATASLRTAYDVDFDSAGGSAVTGQVVPHGDAAATPVTPTRPGWTFSGWRTGAASGPVWDPTAPVLRPVTVVATWTGDPVTAPPTTTPLSTPSPRSAAGGVTLAATAGDAAAHRTVTVATSDLAPGTVWTLTLHSSPVVLASGTVPADGAVSTTAQLPGSVPAGSHRVELTATGADGQPFSTASWFRVAADGTITGVSTTGPLPDVLATTGAGGVVSLTVLGGLLVLAGSGAVVASRRRVG